MKKTYVVLNHIPTTRNEERELESTFPTILSLIAKLNEVTRRNNTSKLYAHPRPIAADEEQSPRKS